LRITEHRILGDEKRERVEIFVDGAPVEAYIGEPILAALVGADINACRVSAKLREKRGCYCGIGRCGECRMVVDGERDVRTCTALVERAGQRIETQWD